MFSPTWLLSSANGSDSPSCSELSKRVMGKRKTEWGIKGYKKYFCWPMALEHSDFVYNYETSDLECHMPAVTLIVPINSSRLSVSLLASWLSVGKNYVNKGIFVYGVQRWGTKEIRQKSRENKVHAVSRTFRMKNNHFLWDRKNIMLLEGIKLSRNTCFLIYHTHSHSTVWKYPYHTKPNCSLRGVRNPEVRRKTIFTKIILSSIIAFEVPDGLGFNYGESCSLKLTFLKKLFKKKTSGA